MGQLYVGDTGKTFRANAGFDMSSNTELELLFTKPDNVEVTKASADGVVIGSSTIEDPDLGTLTINEYAEYPLEADFLDTSGCWCVTVRYTNTATTPDSIFYGAPTTFDVADLC